MDDGYYRFRKALACIAALLILFLLSGCNGETPSPTASVPQPTSVQPTRTLTPFQPSPTPQLLAARVNGEAITLDQFHAELARYQVTVGTQLATEDEQRVIQDMVDRLLLSQAAAEAGYDVDEAAVQNRMDELATRLGDDQALVDWMARHGYTDESFRHDLALSMAAAWMRDKIAAGVPAAVEQVHARQILLYNSEDASEVLVQLSAGADFAALAAEYDPVGKGDLGWFPRGYLLEPELEAVAFDLQPGELSDIIETGTGFHILQIEERETARTLEQDARLALQMLAVQDWLVERRGVSDIEILLP